MQTEHREGMVRIEGAAAIIGLSIDRTYKLSLQDPRFPAPAARQSVVKFWNALEVQEYVRHRRTKRKLIR